MLLKEESLNLNKLRSSQRKGNQNDKVSGCVAQTQRSSNTNTNVICFLELVISKRDSPPHEQQTSTLYYVGAMIIISILFAINACDVINICIQKMPSYPLQPSANVIGISGGYKNIRSLQFLNSFQIQTFTKKTVYSANSTVNTTALKIQLSQLKNIFELAEIGSYIGA